MAEELKKKCFVIMPFSKTTPTHTEEYWTSHYEKFLKPMIESNKSLKAERSSPLRGDILRLIITDLVTVPIVVADLTDANPNVFWELGVRQSFRHCTVTIAEFGFKLPFDLGFKGTIFYYPKDHIKNQKFVEQFNTAIGDCLSNPESPDSHVLETIGGRGTLFQILMKEETLRKLDALLSEISANINLLDRIKQNCETNAELRKKNATTHMVTDRYRTLALESLIVNRYVDADDEFYKFAETYFTQVVACDPQLSKWSEKEAKVEEWLLTIDARIRTRLATYQRMVTKQKKKTLLSL